MLRHLCLIDPRYRRQYRVTLRYGPDAPAEVVRERKSRARVEAQLWRYSGHIVDVDTEYVRKDR